MILTIGIRDLKSFHEERSKSGEESGDDETGDQSSEEDDLDLSDLEATMSSHSTAFLPYRYTRLPCAAHKVGLESLETPLYFIFLIRST